MQDFKRPAGHRARRIVAPALAVVALALSTQAALAITQGKPQLNVEAERSPQGARLTFKGKGWAPSARIKITATRAPGSTSNQDFGVFGADEKGELNARKTAQCSTPNMEDGQNESVTFTAVDSATPANKATAKVQGGAWVCQ
jgi:hypothetical protein